MADETPGEGPIAPDRDGESYDLWDRIAAGNRGPIATPMAEVIDHAAGAKLERLRGIIRRVDESLPGPQTIERLNRLVSELGNRAALDLAEVIDGVAEIRSILDAEGAEGG